MDETKKSHEEALKLMATDEFSVDLDALLRIRAPIIYLTTNEEKRMLNYFKHLSVARGYNTLVWDHYLGLLNLISGKKEKTTSEDIIQPEIILDLIIEQAQEDEKNQAALQSDGFRGTIFLLLDFHRFLCDAPPGIERRLKRLSHIESMTSVIISGPYFESTPALENAFSVLDFPYPNKKEISNALWALVDSDSLKTKLPGLSKIVKEREDELVKAANGLTLNEAQTAFLKSIVMHKKFDIPTILKEKQQIVRKKGVLEFYEPKVDINDIGGLKKMIDWLECRKLAFKSDAEDYGLKPPRGVLLIGTTGCGKAQPLDSIVYTPDGPVKMGDIKVGDFVCTPYGGTTKVTEVHPQGIVPIYEMKFDDNSSVQCCENHLWSVHVRNKDFLSDNVVLPTKQMMDCNTEEGKSKYYIDTPEYVRFHLRGINIHPYLLGIFLTSNVSKDDDDYISLRLGNKDVIPVIENIFKNNYTRYNLEYVEDKENNCVILQIKLRSNELISTLKRYGIWGNKELSIPKEFLFNNYTKRMHLLRGIISADNVFNPGGVVNRFVFSSYQLVLDFRSLVEGLGGSCRIWDNKKDGVKIGYVVYVKIDDFNLYRDCTPFLPTFPKSRYKTKRRINSIKYVGKKEAQCITIGGKQNLYLTDNFVITHNSLTAKAVASFYEMPLLRLDFGKLFNSLVGASEKSARDAVKLAEALAPCVSGDTEILTSDGESVAIKDMLCSDKDFIYTNSFNEKTFQVEKNKICAVIKQPVKKDMINIRSWYASINVTYDHELMVRKNHHRFAWVKAKDIKLGDLLVVPEKQIDSDIMGVKVNQITYIGKQDCYDLMIDNNHNFFANGILSKNCVLWVDEIEKGLSGGQSSGQTDGGTTSRVISTFLTWMQEKEKLVFVICTANDHKQIPPEFMRAGRFDEVFFVDLPNRIEREQIFGVLLRRFKRDPNKFNLKKLAQNSPEYSGAEIEKSIEMSLFEGFKDNKREIKTADIVHALQSFKPLSKTRSDVFDEMRKWAAEYCLLANSDEELELDNSKKGKNIDIDIL